MSGRLITVGEDESAARIRARAIIDFEPGIEIVEWRGCEGAKGAGQSSDFAGCILTLSQAPLKAKSIRRTRAYSCHMCGRYALAALKDEIIGDFGISSLTPLAEERSLPADWNIAPTKDVYLIKGSSALGRDNGEDRSSDMNQERTLDIASWGLIAPWSKSDAEAIKSQSMAINARVETVHEKPTFRDSFKVRRCLVPASGYYEWATELGEYPRKQPIFVSPKEGKFLAFAGIYNFWRSPEEKRTRQSVAIITRDAVHDLAKVHNRMPLFLPHDRWSRWLDTDTPLPEVMDLLRVPEPDENLRFWPVSSRVNSIRNNGPELISPISLGESETLF